MQRTVITVAGLTLAAAAIQNAATITQLAGLAVLFLIAAIIHFTYSSRTKTTDTDGRNTL